MRTPLFVLLLLLSLSLCRSAQKVSCDGDFAAALSALGSTRGDAAINGVVEAARLCVVAARRTGRTTPIPIPWFDGYADVSVLMGTAAAAARGSAVTVGALGAQLPLPQPPTPHMSVLRFASGLSGVFAVSTMLPAVDADDAHGRRKAEGLGAAAGSAAAISLRETLFFGTGLSGMNSWP